MSNSGQVFVVRGDITRCQAAAVIFSTSTELEGSGELHSSFSEWPGFASWYSKLSRQHGVGHTDWLPAVTGSGRPGIVLVRSVGTTNHKDPVKQSAIVLEKALDRAADELRRSGAKVPWLVLVPSLLTGKGGGHDQRMEIARKAVAAAHSFVQRVPEVDVAFVLYTPSNYALFREARRSLRLAPTAPALEAAPELRRAIASGECSLFVGSGVSRAAGMASWDDLIRTLASLAEIKCPKTLPYAKKLRIAETYRACWQRRKLPDVASVVHQVFGAPKDPVLTHYLLAQLEARFVFTTNYDRLLEDAQRAVKRPWRRVSHAHDVPATSRLGVTQVVKLHGDAAPPGDGTGDDAYGDVVLSADDYKHFRRRRAAFDMLLSGLMLNHTFLFVGYSLSDENVRATWTRILKAINKNRIEPRNRRAFGVAFLGDEKLIKGLDWIPNTGTDDASRLRAQWRLLDALAEHVAEPAQMLAPDAPDSALSTLKGQLDRVAMGVAETVGRSKQLPAVTTRTLARIAELLYELGWRSDGNSPVLWEQLADAATERPEEHGQLLEIALAHSRSGADAERLRRRLRALRG